MQALTQADKLQALMQKAVEADFDGDQYMFDDKIVLRANTLVIGGDEGIHVFALLFNRTFAKALFGEDRYGKTLDNMMASINFITRVKYAPAWQVHLQMMVIADDPIGYMYRAVFDND